MYARPSGAKHLAASFNQIGTNCLSICSITSVVQKKSMVSEAISNMLPNSSPSLFFLGTVTSCIVIVALKFLSHVEFSIGSPPLDQNGFSIAHAGSISKP